MFSLLFLVGGEVLVWTWVFFEQVDFINLKWTNMEWENNRKLNFQTATKRGEIHQTHGVSIIFTHFLGTAVFFKCFQMPGVFYLTISLTYICISKVFWQDFHRSFFEALQLSLFDRVPRFVVRGFKSSWNLSDSGSTSKVWRCNFFLQEIAWGYFFKSDLFIYHIDMYIIKYIYIYIIFV